MVHISQLWDLCSAVSCASGPKFGSRCNWDVKSRVSHLNLGYMETFPQRRVFPEQHIPMSSTASRTPDPLPNSCDLLYS